MQAKQAGCRHRLHLPIVQHEWCALLVFEFDRIECWEVELRGLLASELPRGFEATLVQSRSKYVEYGRNIILGLANRDIIVDKISNWLLSQPIVAYHGSRLRPVEIQAIQSAGLRPLIAEERAGRLTSILSSHPRWPEVEAQLPDTLRKYGPANFAGHREGQVHLTLSRAALTYGFNHYLIEGSDGTLTVGASKQG